MPSALPGRAMNRILVYFSDGQKGLSQVHFSQCLLELCHQATIIDKKEEKNSCLPDRHTTYVNCILDQCNLIMSKSSQDCGGILLKHPPFCPMLQIRQEGISGLSSEISSRGVDVGVVALLQSSDNRVLLTRRAAHMRTFPSTWVPPGGHIEIGETLLQALAREVVEETGLIIEASAEENLLCAWESVYPYLLTMGQPKRHHIVLYYLIKLQKSSVELAAETKLDASEVDGASWIDQGLATLIAGGGNLASVGKKTVKILEFCKVTDCWIESELPYSVFLTDAPTSGPDKERVSTGTRFALEEWLKLSSCD